jgi:CubicO group peptidase (beta-lactamase class C family)
MRPSFLSLALAIALGGGAPLAGAATAHSTASTLDVLVPRWMQATHVRGAAVAVVRDGRIEAIKVYGERAPGVPMSADAEFNVASLTKPVFAELVLSLVAQGKLTLDTPLANYWVDPDIAEDPRRLALTSRLTLSHQSGLPNWRKGKLQFHFAPGEGQEYSGEGYEYTRQAIEHLTGTDMGTLMKSHVLAPAGMQHSYFGWNEAVAGHEVAGFDEAGKPLEMDDPRAMAPNAAAQMFTTIGDYARFAQWTLSGAGLPATLRTEMATSQSRQPDAAEYFGLGWRLVQVGADTVLSKDGREGGVRAQAYVLPASHEALVILTNSNNGELLVHPLVDAMLKQGPALNAQVDRDTWHYLLSVPKEQTQAMVMGISRSPSFMSKLLYAVDAALVANAGLDGAERARAHAAVDPFVQGMVDGRVSKETAQALFGQLLHDDQGTMVLWRKFDAAQATAWRQALEAAAK